MHIYKVSEFNRTLNQRLNREVVAIEGEVTGFRNRQDHLVFFDLKDEDSRLTCFCLKHELSEVLEDGAAVRVTGTPGLFVKSGGFHIRVRRVEFLGEGLLKKALEATKKKLEAEGLFAEERKRRLVAYPEKIGIITSLDAAAYTDVLRVLQNRRGGLEIIVAPVAVQGPTTTDEVVGALKYLNAEHPSLDALIITRGGGSLEDLQAFNSVEVARVIYGSRIPVVTGIGHERDWTISDLVADVRGATPSNAAELVSMSQSEGLSTLQSFTFSMNQAIENQVSSAQNRVDDVSEILGGFIERMDHRFSSTVQSIHYALDSLSLRVQQRKEQIRQLKNLFSSVHPRNLLQKGYSITRKNGKVIRKISDVQAGETLQTQVRDGDVLSTVQ